MKITLLTSSLLFIGASLCAQTIGEKELNDIKGSFQKDASTKAIQNVLTNDKNIRDNALNREIQGKIDHYFKYRVKVQGITDQQSSGRCWMFTSMNVLRPSIIEKYNLTGFDFSHNYLYFWDMFEKSNLFLENMIATANKPLDDRDVTFMFQAPVGDGGVWNLYYNLGEKYGVVPKEVMPETAHSNNTSAMGSLINERLRKGGYTIREMAAQGKKIKELRAEKVSILKDIYRILALCLGEPPTTFTWRYKDRNGEIKELANYTPQQFYKEITPADYSPKNYIMIMNDPTREYYKVYDIQNYRNTVEGINWVYLNLPNEDIKEAAIASIKGNEAMYTSSDVGKYFNRETGILDPEMYDYNSLMGVDFSMDKKTRILTRQSGSAHAMSLVAVDVDANGKPTKWEFENSWGPQAGHNGYLTFTDKWFDEYIFRVVIHKKYLGEKALKALDQKPILLPMWDYMFYSNNKHNARRNLRALLLFHQFPPIHIRQHSHLLDGNPVQFQQTLLLIHTFLDENGIQVFHVRKADQFIDRGIIPNITLQIRMRLPPFESCHPEHGHIQHVSLIGIHLRNPCRRKFFRDQILLNRVRVDMIVDF